MATPFDIYVSGTISSTAAMETLQDIIAGDDKSIFVDHVRSKINAIQQFHTSSKFLEDLEFQKNLYISGNTSTLTVDAISLFNNTVTVNDSKNVNIGTSAGSTGQLAIYSTTNLYKPITVSNNNNVSLGTSTASTGVLSVYDVSNFYRDVLIDANLTLNKDVIIGDALTDTLTIHSTSSITGNIAVSASKVDIQKNTTLGTSNTDTLTIHSTSTIHGNVTVDAYRVDIQNNVTLGSSIADQLTVNALANLHGNVVVDASKTRLENLTLQQNFTSPNINTLGYLSVTGNSAIGTSSANLHTMNSTTLFQSPLTVANAQNCLIGTSVNAGLFKVYHDTTFYNTITQTNDKNISIGTTNASTGYLNVYHKSNIYNDFVTQDNVIVKLGNSAVSTGQISINGPLAINNTLNTATNKNVTIGAGGSTAAITIYGTSFTSYAPFVLNNTLTVASVQTDGGFSANTASIANQTTLGSDVTLGSTAANTILVKGVMQCDENVTIATGKLLDVFASAAFEDTFLHVNNQNAGFGISNSSTGFLSIYHKSNVYNDFTVHDNIPIKLGNLATSTGTININGPLYVNNTTQVATNKNVTIGASGSTANIIVYGNSITSYAPITQNNTLTANNTVTSNFALNANTMAASGLVSLNAGVNLGTSTSNTITVKGLLQANENATFSKNMTVTGNTLLTGTTTAAILISPNATFGSGNVTIVGATTTLKNVDITGNVVVTGINTTLTDLNASSCGVSGDLLIEQNTILGTNAANTLLVNAVSTFSGNVVVNNNKTISLGTSTSSNTTGAVKVYDASTFYGTVSSESTLTQQNNKVTNIGTSNTSSGSFNVYHKSHIYNDFITEDDVAVKLGNSASSLGQITINGSLQVNNALTVATGKNVTIGASGSSADILVYGNSFTNYAPFTQNSTITASGLITANGGISSTTIQASGDTTLKGASAVSGFNALGPVKITTIDTLSLATLASLSVTGTSALNDNITVATGKSLTINGTSAANALTVNGTTAFNENITVATGKSLALSGTGYLSAGSGASTFAGSISVSGDTTLKGGSASAGFNALGAVKVTTLDATGASTLAALTASGTLDVSGDTTLKGGTSSAGFNVLGAAKATTLATTSTVGVGGAFTVTGLSTLNDNVTIAATKTLSVGGLVTASSGISVPNDKPISFGTTSASTGAIAAYGPTTVYNILTVNGTNATTLGGSLGVTGATTLSSILDVSGDTTLKGASASAGYNALGPVKVTTLDASGAVVLSSTFSVANTVTLSSTLNVSGDTTLKGASAVAGYNALGPVKITTLDASGLVTANVGIQVPNNQAVNIGTTAASTGAISLYGPSMVYNTLTVNGSNATSLGGSLTVSGIATLNDNVTITASKTLIVGGLITASSGIAVPNDKAVSFGTTNASTGVISAYGPTTVYNTLTVNGANATTLGGTLGVTGATTLSSTLNVSGDTVLKGGSAVSGFNTLGPVKVTTLAASGAVVLSSTFSVANTVTLSNTLGVSGDTVLKGGSAVSGFNALGPVKITTIDTSSLATLASLSVTGTSTLNDNVTISSTKTLGVGGLLTASSGISVPNDKAVSFGSTSASTGAIACYGPTTCYNTFAANSTSTFTGLVTANGGISSTTLGSSGLATLNSLDVTTSAIIYGNLTVNGSLIKLNTVTVDVLDTNISMAYNVTDPALFNGGGITVGSGGSAVSIIYDNTAVKWNSTIGLNIVNGTNTTSDTGATFSTSEISFGADTASVKLGSTSTGGVLIDKTHLTFGDSSAVITAGSASLSSTLSVGGVLTSSSGISVPNDKAVSFGTTSASTGVISAYGPTTVYNTLTVNGANATSLGGSLGVTGATTLSSTLNVSGDTVLKGSSASAGFNTLGPIKVTTLAASGAVALSSIFSVANTVTLSNTLSVSGDTTLKGSSAVAGYNALGPVKITTVDTSSLATLASLSVTGTSALNDNVTIATGKALTINGTSAANALTVSGTAAFNENVTIASTKTLGVGALTVTGTTALNDNVTVATGKSLTLSGTGYIAAGSGASIFGGSVAITGTVTHTSTTALNDNVTIATGKSLTIAGTSAANALTVSGTAAFNENVTMATGKSLTIAGTSAANALTVSGTAAFNENVTVATGKSLTINGTSAANALTVSGTSAFNENITVATGKSLTLSGTGYLAAGTGASTLGGSMTVAGDTTLKGGSAVSGFNALGPIKVTTIDASSNATVGGTMTVTGDVTLGGNVTYAGLQFSSYTVLSTSLIPPQVNVTSTSTNSSGFTFNITPPTQVYIGFGSYKVPDLPKFLIKYTPSGGSETSMPIITDAKVATLATINFYVAGVIGTNGFSGSTIYNVYNMVAGTLYSVSLQYNNDAGYSTAYTNASIGSKTGGTPAAPSSVTYTGPTYTGSDAVYSITITQGSAYTDKDNPTDAQPGIAGYKVYYQLVSTAGWDDATADKSVQTSSFTYTTSPYTNTTALSLRYASVYMVTAATVNTLNAAAGTASTAVYIYTGIYPTNLTRGTIFTTLQDLTSIATPSALSSCRYSVLDYTYRGSPSATMTSSQYLIKRASLANFSVAFAGLAMQGANDYAPTTTNATYPTSDYQLAISSNSGTAVTETMFAITNLYNTSSTTLTSAATTHPGYQFTTITDPHSANNRKNLYKTGTLNVTFASSGLAAGEVAVQVIQRTYIQGTYNAPTAQSASSSTISYTATNTTIPTTTFTGVYKFYIDEITSNPAISVFSINPTGNGTYTTISGVPSFSNITYTAIFSVTNIGMNFVCTTDVVKGTSSNLTLSGVYTLGGASMSIYNESGCTTAAPAVLVASTAYFVRMVGLQVNASMYITTKDTGSILFTAKSPITTTTATSVLSVFYDGLSISRASTGNDSTYGQRVLGALTTTSPFSTDTTNTTTAYTVYDYTAVIVGNANSYYNYEALLTGGTFRGGLSTSAWTNYSTDYPMQGATLPNYSAPTSNTRYVTFQYFSFNTGAQSPLRVSLQSSNATGSGGIPDNCTVLFRAIDYTGSYTTNWLDASKAWLGGALNVIAAGSGARDPTDGTSLTDFYVKVPPASCLKFLVRIVIPSTSSFTCTGAQLKTSTGTVITSNFVFNGTGTAI